MYRGVNQLKVDGKGRIALPTRYREELIERCDGAMVVTISNNKDQCLWMYPLDAWEPVEKEIVGLSSFVRRYFTIYKLTASRTRTIKMRPIGK